MSDADDSSDSAHTVVDGSKNVTHRKKKTKRVSIDPMCEIETMSTDLRKINLKVPPFSTDDPEIWFALLEGQFDNFDITDDKIKFNNVISNLDITLAKAVKDIIIKPPALNRYEKIKSELIRRLCASHEKKVKQLLNHEELGDRKPSQFLRHLLDLAGPSIPEDFVQSIWTSRLPKNLQTVLASQTSQTLEQLADLADRIQEIAAPCSVAATSAGPSHSGPTSEIAELRKMVEHLALKLDEHTRRSNERGRSRERRRSKSRSNTRSESSYRLYPVCWYHSKFGSRASSCIKPCDFNKAKNSTGSR